jgi:LysR family hydrogen peroxide-inducible transcriptional activator
LVEQGWPCQASSPPTISSCLKTVTVCAITLAACALEGAHRNAGFQGTSLHILVQMVANGLGVTLVPRMALAAGILRGLGLAAVPFKDGPSRQIGLAWRTTSGREFIFRELAEVPATSAG